MSTIPTLLLIGNRLFAALVKEAQLGLEEFEWECARSKILEFESHMGKHLEAMSEVLFPKVVVLNPIIEKEVKALQAINSRIATLTDTAVQAIHVQDSTRTWHLLDELIELLTGQWMSQQQLVYTMTDDLDQQLLIEMASRLAESEYISAGGDPAGEPKHHK